MPVCAFNTAALQSEWEVNERGLVCVRAEFEGESAIHSPRHEGGDDGQDP